MPVFYPAELIGVSDGTVPISRADGRTTDAKMKRIRRTITLAAQAAGTDQFYLGELPPGAAFHECHVQGSVTTTATIAIGTSATHGSNGQFRAAAAVGAANVKERTAPLAAVIAAPFTAVTPVWMTWAGAALPASGTLVVELFYSTQQ